MILGDAPCSFFSINAPSSTEGTDNMDRMIDLHAHPSLKMHYLPYLRSTFHAKMYSGPIWNPLSFRYQYGNLKRSPVKVLFCTHYVIERDFVAKGVKPHSRALLWSTAPYYYARIRFAKPWESLLKLMETCEAAVRNTNRWVFGKNPRLVMAKSLADINGLADNEIAVVHAIEGPHVFGYELEKGQTLDDYWQRTLRRLDYLEKRGVAMLTLAHFWDNLFVPQTDGTELIPKVKDNQVVAGRDDLLVYMKRANWRWGDRGRLGEELVRELFRRGILADLSHVQVHAREAIYDIAQEVGRPVIISHVGLKHFYDHEYNLSDEEIKRIHALGGVIGLILSKRLLVDPIDRYGDDGIGIPDLIENMKYIRQLTGDVSAIGIGTDFDGLTHPFKDCYHPGQLHRIIDAMKAHFSPEEIDAILYGNSWRAMENGWGSRRSETPVSLRSAG